MAMQNWISLQHDHGTHMLKHSNTAEF